MPAKTDPEIPGPPRARQVVAVGKLERALQGGCCGLAGSWGFEDGKYGISTDRGEQARFPAVRDTDEDTHVVADVFSCRTRLGDAGLPEGRRAARTGTVLALGAGAAGLAASGWLRRVRAVHGRAVRRR